MDVKKGKNFADTYLFNLSPEYRKNIVRFVMEGERIDKSDDSFKDIVYEVSRRQSTSVVSRVLKHPDIILVRADKPMPRALKVFTCKDLKVGRESRKVFIDVSDLFRMKDGAWYCYKVDVLVAYLISAMVHLIYHENPTRLTLATKIAHSGTKAYAELVTYIIDYLFKISSVDNMRNRCMFITAMFYQVNILRRSAEDQSVKDLAAKVAKLNARESDIVMMYIKDDSFKDISTLIATLSDALKLSKLTLDVFMDKWLYLYGSGTHFSTELFTSFSSMMTDAYTGTFINNQKTIEKIVGQDMLDFSKAVITLGGSVL